MKPASIRHAPDDAKRKLGTKSETSLLTINPNSEARPYLVQISTTELVSYLLRVDGEFLREFLVRRESEENLGIFGRACLSNSTDCPMRMP
jgi:hypothetical protein